MIAKASVSAVRPSLVTTGEQASQVLVERTRREVSDPLLHAGEAPQEISAKGSQLSATPGAASLAPDQDLPPNPRFEVFDDPDGLRVGEIHVARGAADRAMLFDLLEQPDDPDPHEGFAVGILEHDANINPHRCLLQASTMNGSLTQKGPAAHRLGYTSMMMPKKLILLVTGSVASGKTTLLERLHAATRRHWGTCGFVAPGEGHGRAGSLPARSYDLVLLNGSARLPWAERRTSDDGYEFDEDTRAEVEGTVREQIAAGRVELCFLDEIGRLELGGGGFADLFRSATASDNLVVIASVKKTALGAVIRSFALEDPVVVDLDVTSIDIGLRRIRRLIAGRDAERIGAFAGVSGLVEVGLGSMLHAYRVPLAGHALAYLQNLLLVTFGKALHGRGLVRIAFIGAALKAFSPAGGALRPMVFIFLQGSLFALPVRLLGWNIAAVLLGSVLMAWLTLVFSLAVDYVLFGSEIFTAYAGVVAAAARFLSAGDASLWQAISVLLGIKAALAIGVGLATFYGDPQPLVTRLGRMGKVVAPVGASSEPARAPSRFWTRAVGALRDVARPRFFLLFLVSVLLLVFFTGMSRGDLLALVLRGVCLSYLGFLVIRSLDIRRVGSWLDQRTGLGLGESLPVALETLGRSRRENRELKPVNRDR